MDIMLFSGPILLFYLFIRLLFIRKSKLRMMKEISRITFLAYISALIFIVWIDQSTPVNYLLYNFVPFKTIFTYIEDLISRTNPFIAFKNILGNVLLTLPIGFYCVIFTRGLSKAKLIGLSIVVPLIIECGQYLLFLTKLGGLRSVDIDDLILNSIGIITGYYFTMYLLQKSHKKQQQVNNYN
ncbi:VanZ family protein [Anoxybacteroides rupiense]|uniref:VanZ family protein n=1 Tax=Anoxybacteroides rupiense TaxID=311460 RepID=UPI0035D8A287